MSLPSILQDVGLMAVAITARRKLMTEKELRKEDESNAQSSE
jgi:hypothetical protein